MISNDSLKRELHLKLCLVDRKCPGVSMINKRRGRNEQILPLN